MKISNNDHSKAPPQLTAYVNSMIIILSKPGEEKKHKESVRKTGSYEPAIRLAKYLGLNILGGENER